MKASTCRSRDQRRMTLELSSVPLSLTVRSGLPRWQRRQLACDKGPGQRCDRHQGQALPAEVIDHRHEAEAPAADAGVRHEVAFQRWFGFCGTVIGARVPNARLCRHAGEPSSPPHGRSAAASCGWGRQPSHGRADSRAAESRTGAPPAPAPPVRTSAGAGHRRQVAPASSRQPDAHADNVAGPTLAQVKLLADKMDCPPLRVGRHHFSPRSPLAVAEHGIGQQSLQTCVLVLHRLQPTCFRPPDHRNWALTCRSSHC
jgi:hypothetical protein